MSEPEWRIRSGQLADHDLLSSFDCANPAIEFEVEVEHFIRTQLIDWTFAPGAADDDPRLLLALVRATGELFGVAAHELVIFQGSDGSLFKADARVFGIVHKGNQRSISLCRRYGLVEEMSSPDPNYRRLVTAHRPPLQDHNRP